MLPRYIAVWISAILLLIPVVYSQETPLPPASPQADLIRTVATDVSGETGPGIITIIGDPGAVPASNPVIIRNLATGVISQGDSSADGSFSLTIQGTPHTAYQIHTPQIAPQTIQPGSLLPGPGTIIHRMPPIPFGGRIPFEISGNVARGAATWQAYGSVNSLRLNPGDPLSVQMDVSMDIASADVNQPWRMSGTLSLTPVIDVAGKPVSNGFFAGQIWSSQLTRTGLPVNLPPEIIPLETVIVDSISRQENTLVFSLVFNLTVPSDFTPGIYVPVFQGQAQLADSELFDWYDNRIFSTDGTGLDGTSITRIPVPLTIGQVENPRLLWSLFYNAQGNHHPGTLPVDSVVFDRSELASQVTYSTANRTLPPGNYPLTPCLPAQIPAYPSQLAAPLVPLKLPGGQLQASITRPDGVVETLPTVALTQYRFVPEQAVTDTPGNTPVQMICLATSNPDYDNYDFSVYGQYEISLTGYLEDTFGRQYDGSGVYRLLIAENTTVLPAVLPGTPFEEQDVFTPAIQIYPALPAEVTMNLRFYPAGRNLVTHTVTGRASRDGLFYSDSAFRFDAAGEYVVDYDIRYTDFQGRFFATTLRSAGVVAGADSSLVGHGQRGSYDMNGPERPWFDLSVYAPEALDIEPVVNYPYFSGDVAYLPDIPEAGLYPVIQLQDKFGLYTESLLQQYPDFVSERGNLDQRIAEAALPIIYTPESYAYISTVRPAVQLRQFVHAQQDRSVDTYWQNDETFQNQPGTGINGNRPGDIIFLFGGAVVPDDTAIYAASAIVTDADTAGKILPPFQEPLFTLNETPVMMLFHLTATRPGQIINVGDMLSIAGYMIPALPANILIRAISPSGMVSTFEGIASESGYYYDPAVDFVAGESGVWTIEIQTEFCGETSAGLIEEPCPVGQLYSLTGNTYQVYVVPEQNLPLETDYLAEQPVIPAQAQTITLTIPENWTEPRVFYSVSTPAVILDTGELSVSGTQVSYTFDPAELSTIFPNLEADGDGSGAAASDMIRLSFAVTGRNAAGLLDTRAISFDLLHDRLIPAQ